MKTFDIRTRFIFDGVFEVKAKNGKEAIEKVEKHCGLVIGGDIHSTLPEDEIDWEFNVHPEKRILKAKRTD